MRTEKQITRSNLTECSPLADEGVKPDGIYIKVLRADENTRRSPTILQKI